MNFKLIIICLFFVSTIIYATQKVDVLIVGGGASGTTAGIQAARMGTKTLIAEETSWLGGMLTAAGVSAIDGNSNLPSGIFGEFCDNLVSHYGNAKALQTGWVSNVLFEPSVGNKILTKMTDSEKNLTVWFNTTFVSAKKTYKGWTVVLQKGKSKQSVFAKVLIDATELGDVAKFCGVKYDIGMEARAECGEDIAPIKANNIIQDLTYVMILKDFGKNVTIEKPRNYNPALFYCTAKSKNCTNPKPGQTVWDASKMMQYGKLQNGKYMINWPIEGNDYYLNLIELGPHARKIELEKAKHFSLCYLYYLQTELGYSNLGLSNDEFPTADKFPMIPYYRESRRIHGLVRFNVNDVAKPFSQTTKLYRTGVAVGDYPIDHHHKRYPEWEKLPDLHFYPVPSYCLPLGALVPNNVNGLIVAEKSISVSNLMNGSTRLQPVVMQIGQAAGTLAALSVTQNIDVSRVKVRNVQKVLLDAGGYILPYLDFKKQDFHFKALQRIGATGILKGIGMNVGWSNQTWFKSDSLVQISELKEGLKEFEPKFSFEAVGKYLTIEQSVKIINELSVFYNKNKLGNEKIIQDWEKLHLFQFDSKRYISRKEFSVILDYYINPFELKNVSMDGNFIY